MSSNPFRRSKLPDEAPPLSTASLEIGTRDATPSTITPKRTKKKVKIQTPPPQSPALIHHSPENNAGRRLSASDSAARADSPPPPPSAFEESENESDSTATADSELEEAIRNTRRNSGSLPPQLTPSTGAGKAPYNPFARTLATKQAAFGLDQGSAEDEGMRGLRGDGRPPLDVESFKNILLTGSATPSPPAGGAGSATLVTVDSRPQDSGSSTDISSIFDPGSGMHPESPRTSFDDYEDASSSEDDNGDESSNLMGGGRSDDFAPPAPPKPKVRGPQTVSFADFDQSIPPDYQSTGRAIPPVNPLTGILRPSLPRSLSDLNKPLPPPPQGMQEPSPPSVPEKDFALSPQITPTGPVVDAASTPQKGVPPPPPPTRRKAGDSGRPVSMSNKTQDPAGSVGAPNVRSHRVALREDESSHKLTPPPPPPSRNLQPISDVTSETILNHSVNELSKIVPTPPPRRHNSKTRKGENSARASFDTSRPLRPGDAFLAAVTPNNPPPAPPPRRVGSKRSSLDDPQRQSGHEASRRESEHSSDSQRSTSTPSLQRLPKPDESNEQAVVTPPAQSQRDILADLNAFQAEIDALRAQAGDGR